MLQHLGEKFAKIQKNGQKLSQTTPHQVHMQTKRRNKIPKMIAKYFANWQETKREKKNHPQKKKVTTMHELDSNHSVRHRRNSGATLTERMPCHST